MGGRHGRSAYAESNLDRVLNDFLTHQQQREEARDKRDEARDKRDEARDKREEARDKREEERDKRQEEHHKQNTEVLANIHAILCSPGFHSRA